MKENMKNYSKKRELLIDGDIIIYKVALQEEQAIKWDENLWTLHVYEDKAIAAVDEAIKKLQRDLRCKTYKIALTSPNNFRKDVLPSYKSNRKGVRKPMILPVLRQHIMDNHKGIMWDGLEADDVLGILATTADNHYDKDPVIVSIDKDFKQIPSLICLDGENIVRISRPAADYWQSIRNIIQGLKLNPSLLLWRIRYHIVRLTLLNICAAGVSNMKQWLDKLKI